MWSLIGWIAVTITAIISFWTSFIVFGMASDAVTVGERVVDNIVATIMIAYGSVFFWVGLIMAIRTAITM